MIRKLKKEIREYIDKRSASLKMYRYKERGIEFMLDRVVPTDANKLQLIASKHPVSYTHLTLPTKRIV